MGYNNEDIRIELTDDVIQFLEMGNVEYIDNIKTYHTKQGSFTETDIKNIYIIRNKDRDRATGRTTRLVQYYIDLLFSTDNIVEIRDHFNHIAAHSYLTELIIKRFNNELNRGHKILTRVGRNALQLTNK
jgi:hypothetical protein